MDLEDIVTESTPSLPWEDQLNATGSSSTLVPMLSLFTYPERAVAAVCYLLISIVNFTGNSTVILAVVFSKKPRTSTNVFVVSLSVADLLTGLGQPMNVITLLSPGDESPFSTEAPCFVSALLVYISAGASLLHLACIALNRAVLIKRPMTTYLWLYTRRNLAIMVAAIWVISLSVMLIPPLVGVGGFGLDKQYRTCSDIQGHPRGATFELIQAVTFFVVPLIVIVTSYTTIFIHVRRHFKTQRAQCEGSASELDSLSTGKANSKASTSTAVKEDSRRHQLSRQQIRITKNLFTAVCVFFLCVTPYMVANLLSASPHFLLFSAILLLCNSCVNPIIYAAKHPQFKTVMRRMLRCKYSQIEEPSGTLKFLIVCCNKKHQSRQQNKAPPNV